MNKTEYLLSKLVEESCEVGQRACKAMTFGLSEVQPGQQDDNKRRIEIELADLMEIADQLGLVVHEDDKTAKRKKLAKFMDYSRECGTLVDDSTEKK